MDVGSVLNIASSLQAQRLEQSKLEANVGLLKDQQEFQTSMVAKLLASLPSVNPDGVGERIDITM